MYGNGNCTSTTDAILALKGRIIDKYGSASEIAILAADVKSAFETVPDEVAIEAIKRFGANTIQ